MLHISDIHFPDQEWNSPMYIYLDAFHKLIDEINDRDLLLILGGDITTRGNAKGYQQAEAFFNDIIKKKGLNRKHVLLCPGNHDIESSSPYFNGFDVFAYSVRNDRTFKYTESNHYVFETDECFFLIINSAYKYDHRYGSVDVEGITATLGKLNINPNKNKIAIVHHHLLGQFEDDVSTIRNAYPFLQLLDYYNFQYIIHGHQHSNMYMPLGKSRIKTIGVRTPTLNVPGYFVGVNVYELRAEELIIHPYIFSRDMGGFTKLEEIILGRD
ncbi:metallophosphoesterase [Bacillus subtilis]|nr:metallophosphoesterase [Bacillus subtilis]MEC0364228.1 metallophosphoesterase [Bacillus subtilis]WEZ02403.1 metallophosphoesterase [Bacillus subtilis]